MNLSRKLLDLDEKSKERKCRELNKKKNRNLIMKIGDMLVAAIIPAPSLFTVVYLMCNYKENPNGIGLFVAFMSTMFFLYSLISELLKKYKYLLLNSLYIIVFVGGIIAALFAFKIPDEDGNISVWISAGCLIFTIIIEIIKNINYYSLLYSKKDDAIKKQIRSITETGSFEYTENQK